jgi:hypothetical protein
MQHGKQLWILPLTAVVIYPGFLLSFDAAINAHHESGSTFMAVGAVLAMLLAGSIPVLAIRALLLTRHDAGPVLARGMLYVMFATPSLFSLTVTLTRLAGVRQLAGLVTLWVSAWLAIGLMLYVRRGRSTSQERERQVTRLRVVHGVTALCLLCGFLLAHLANHSLAIWSADLHGVAMDWLRGWYRSDWIEPVLLALMLVMIGTGIPMVAHYSRQRMDAFRVVQAATGVYMAVFICSHVVAVLNGRRVGLDTNWAFAAGPASLLDGTSLLGRLIPHYVCGTHSLILHVACGLRVVLLQHGATQMLVNRAVYGLASVAVVVTVLIAAALMGLHVGVAE